MTKDKKPISYEKCKGCGEVITEGQPCLICKTREPKKQNLKPNLARAKKVLKGCEPVRFEGERFSFETPYGEPTKEEVEAILKARAYSPIREFTDCKACGVQRGDLLHLISCGYQEGFKAGQESKEAKIEKLNQDIIRAKEKANRKLEEETECNTEFQLRLCEQKKDLETQLASERELREYSIDWRLLPMIDEWYCEVAMVYWRDSQRAKRIAELRYYLEGEIKKLRGSNTKPSSNGNLGKDKISVASPVLPNSKTVNAEKEEGGE